MSDDLFKNLPTDYIRFFLIGADNQTRWAFGGEGSPVRLHKPPQGLQGAPFEHDYQELVGLDGAVYKGTRDKHAEVQLQVWVADKRSSAWARAQHALWRESLGRGKDTVRLVCVTRESGYWWIDLRVSNVAEVNYFDQYPGRVGEMGEQLNCVSDRAFWQKFEEIREFNRDTCHAAQLVNYGDQEAWLRWTVTGQHDGIELGVEDDTITLPGQKSTDAGYYIDTDEVWPALMDTTGVDLQEKHPHAYWKKPLPPRSIDRKKATALTIRPINPATDFKVEVAYTPRAEQAW